MLAPTQTHGFCGVMDLVDRQFAMSHCSLEQTRILVVDDERIIADSLSAILRAADFETAVAYNGADAVSAAATFRPDIVISDYAMPPGMDGLEATAKIKQLLPGCKVVMLSGQILGREFAPYQTKGYNFLLLTKPIHPKDLLNEIRGENAEETDLERRPTILNVDDVEPHRYSISRLLARSGFEVLEAATGREAVQRAIESKPELVLLDIHLPDITGYDVCQELKKNPDTALVSVVHITASDTSPESELRSANAGADAFLTHPILPARLIHRIRELLQAKYLRQQ